MACALGEWIVLLCDKLRWDKNVPFKSVQLSFETFAKVEKYLALWGSSPPRIANIFMSFGNSAHLKVT